MTLKGGYERRPDLVMYVNGIAIAVIELKRSSVEVGDGVRQLITNQEPDFNQPFFPTVQLLLAGNDAQGLRYGTVHGLVELVGMNVRAEHVPCGLLVLAQTDGSARQRRRNAFACGDVE